MINQRSYPDILLGYSKTLTVAGYGCYMVSLLQGLIEKGITFTVAQWNELLKSSGVYTPENPTLIAASTIEAKLSNIFEVGNNEAWNDANIVKYLNDKSYIVLGEVSAKGIGGSGQHFVKIDHVDVRSDGKISMTYIDDPWDGLENQKVTTRYNTFGNILSLRVFKIKPGSTGGNMANMYKGYDLANPESMKVAVDVLVRLQSGDLVDKSKYTELENNISQKVSDAVSQTRAEDLSRCNTELVAQSKQLTAEKETAVKQAFDKGYAKGKAEAPTVPTTPAGIPEGFEINGVQTQEEVNGVVITKNYAKKE